MGLSIRKKYRGKIIYGELYRKFKELLDNKDKFLDESESLYKDALDKYCEQ